MSTQPSPTFTFDGYTVRPVTEQDRPYLELLIKADVYHCDRMDGDYFLNLLPGETSWALEDEHGRVVFYFKCTPAVRMSIQFAAEHDLAGKRRNMTALLKGLAWIEAIFRAARFREIFFDTEGPELTVFAKRHLGFVDAAHLLCRPLDMPNAPKIEPEAVGRVPTGRLERVG